MKKLVLTTVCALAVTGGAFAQGTVQWANMGSTIIGETNSAISGILGGTQTGGTSGFGAINNAYFYELLYNTSFSGAQAAVPTYAQLFSGGWHDTGLQAINGPGQNGRIVGNPANTGASVPATWNNGTTNNIILVGWSANLGTTWGSVSNLLGEAVNGQTSSLFTQLAGTEGFFGMSSTGYINPSPTGTSPGAIVFGPTATASGLPINSPGTSPLLMFGLQPIPEPATMALMGLGGLSLLLFRRQRKS